MRSLICALSFVIGSILPSQQTVGDEATPNIVLIYADDLGYGDLGCFGGKSGITPHIDRLSNEGRRFTNFHVSQPVCSASRASLLTGCYANRLGIHGALGPKAKVGLSDREETIADLLKTKGYATGMAGKWHLGHERAFLPTRHGFDEYFGLPYSNDMWPNHPEARPGSYPKLPLLEGESVKDDDVDAIDQGLLTTQYTERAVKFIHRNKDRRFFFYLAHSMPHVPLHINPELEHHPESNLYQKVLQEIDWSVGEILKALEQCGVDNKTLVIFASDNGPWLSYGDHAGSAGKLREGKGTCWEGGVRVPCLMRWPGRIPAGSTCNEMMMTIDLLPTLANLVGASLPKNRIDGLDVWPLIAGDSSAKNPHSSYWFYFEQNQLQAVMSGDGRWKLQLPHTYRSLSGRSGGSGGKPVAYDSIRIDKPELYDLHTDVGEALNLVDKHPQRVLELLNEVEKARLELGDSLTGRTGVGTRKPGRMPD